ncbi:hypothetical protein V4F39_10460 [Aquincola sp. MAHUQ-54]|uniref:Ribbon-helix-helix CopG family protein n=1 Tax=Aquincola agrisoli TaxID=3119538 RepID=A0AAW9QA71_9BURK
MANLTIAIDDELLKQARIKAVHDGTSVNEVCRQALERYALESSDTPEARIAKLRALAAQARPSPDGKPAWPGREALYEEVLRERGLLKP